MAVAWLTQASGNNNVVTTNLSFAVGTGIENSVLIFGCLSRGSNLDSVRWRPVPADPGQDQHFTRIQRNNVANAACETWILVNPTPSASGTITAINNAGDAAAARRKAFGVGLIEGVDQSSPVRDWVDFATSTGGGIDLTVNSQPDDLVVGHAGGVQSSGMPTPTAGQTIRWQNTFPASGSLGASGICGTLPGESGSTNMTWDTGAIRASSLVALRAAGAPPPPPSRTFVTMVG